MTVPAKLNLSVATNPNSTMLSVISYNVMFNNVYIQERHNALLALLKKNSADIICLQEVLTELVEWFSINLSGYSPVMDILQPTGRAYGELVFVKNGIIPVMYECVPLSGKMGRALQHVEIKKDQVTYNVVTFHLESMNCSKVRRSQLETMWKHIAHLPNVICCGDTNQTGKELYTVPNNILDAWEQTNGKIGEYTYYSSRFWDGDRKQRYDKVWYSNDFTVAGFGILGNKPIAQGIWISDHDGLYCLFK
ncbi:hypothetical protein LCGC14_1559670 [marine sediment metagenome]|uniref:Endonuclease/exonuclease/phosphatase domain-containing protein n=2 Tax=root TaxID=1 RepID=A0A0F9J8V4_9ZZZZ|nr:MAG: endonuclease/exonuclease/phosphatase family protein [Marseillevirus LCMAC202]